MVASILVESHDRPFHVAHDLRKLAIGVHQLEMLHDAPEVAILPAPHLEEIRCELALAPEDDVSRRIQTNDEVGFSADSPYDRTVQPSFE